MLTFPGDHDIFLSIPCNYRGSRHSAEIDYIDYLSCSEVPIENSDYDSKSKILAELIPCRNTRLCLLRIFSRQMTYSQLANFLGIHRANSRRLVLKFIQKLRAD
jgi:hypothetical protein